MAKPKKERYNNKYDNVLRFISYFYQTDLVRRLKPDNVLEIGVGNKTVSNYLKQHGIKVDTCDYDKNLKPDHVADIRDLPFDDNSYDVVVAYEILEHIPWKDVGKALNELHRVSKKHVIISIPHPALAFEFVFKLPFINKLHKGPFMDLFLGSLFSIGRPNLLMDIIGR